MKARGTGHLYRRGDVWWVQYYHHGQRIRESAQSAVRADAARLLRRRLGEIGTGRFVGPDGERVTFEQLAAMIEDDYRANGRKSLRRALLSVKHLREYFGHDRAVEITSDRIAAYVRARREAGAQPATIRLELAALKRMFTLAVQAGRIGQRPHVPSLEVRNVRSGFFEEPEMRAVLARLSDDLRPVIEFAYLTGWRAGSSCR